MGKQCPMCTHTHNTNTHTYNTNTQTYSTHTYVQHAHTHTHMLTNFSKSSIKILPNKIPSSYRLYRHGVFKRLLNIGKAVPRGEH